jgi:hypothetical protein
MAVKERLAVGSRWQGHGYVFASQAGTRLDASDVRRVITKGAEAMDRIFPASPDPQPPS